MKNFNRRSFLSGSFFFSIAALVTGRSALAQNMRAKKGATPAVAGPTLIDPKDPLAVSLNYVTDKSKVSKDKQKDASAKGTPFADQRCNNCSFYANNAEKDVAGKKAAGCTVLANKLVVADAWCMSWNKKT